MGGFFAYTDPLKHTFCKHLPSIKAALAMISIRKILYMKVEKILWFIILKICYFFNNHGVSVRLYLIIIEDSISIMNVEQYWLRSRRKRPPKARLYCLFFMYIRFERRKKVEIYSLFALNYVLEAGFKQRCAFYFGIRKIFNAINHLFSLSSSRRVSC